MDRLAVCLGTFRCVIDLANGFSIDIAPESQEQFAFMWDRCQWTFLVFP